MQLANSMFLESSVAQMVDDCLLDTVNSIPGLIRDHFDLSLGVDCESIERWRSDPPAFLGDQGGVFDPEEHRYCRSFSDPAPHYVGKWCAKEAVLKALRGCELSLRDIKILNRSDGSPYAVIEVPRCMQADAHVCLSVSHDSRVAIAVALVTTRRRSGV
jgi:phosphopantetheine--protein transferase-like protein